MHEHSDMKLNFTIKASLVLGAVLIITLSSCVDPAGGPLIGGNSVGPVPGYYSNGYNNGYGSNTFPGYGYGYAGLNNPGNYTYYPQYGTYYNNRSRQYSYQNGSSWVSRSSPYQVSSTVLRSSPYVPLNLQNSPSHHHSQVIQSYPRNWVTPVNSQGQGLSLNHNSRSFGRR